MSCMYNMIQYIPKAERAVRDCRSEPCEKGWYWLMLLASMSLAVENAQDPYFCTIAEGMTANQRSSGKYVDKLGIGCDR